ncbi:MAG: hypothetical protein ACI3Y0_12865 [Prevotella sp.]
MKYIALLLIWLAPLAGIKAQNVKEDGKSVAVDSMKWRDVEYMEMNESALPATDIFKLEVPEAVMPTDLQSASKINPQAYTLPQLTLNVPSTTWKGGILTATGAMLGNPGLLDIASGGLMASQRFGNLHLSVQAEANKYNFMWQGGVHTQYGVSGLLTYDFNRSLSLTAFGAFYDHTIHTGPALIPYVNSNVYGGYATIMFTDNFGADIGVKRYINPMTGRWNTDPIVSPFLKRGKQKWNIDLGGLLRDAIWGKRYDMIPMTPPMKK